MVKIIVGRKYIEDRPISDKYYPYAKYLVVTKTDGVEYYLDIYNNNGIVCDNGIEIVGKNFNSTLKYYCGIKFV